MHFTDKKKLRHREGKSLPKVTVSKWQSPDSNPGSLGPEPFVLYRLALPLGAVSIGGEGQLTGLLFRELPLGPDGVQEELGNLISQVECTTCEGSFHVLSLSARREGLQS